MSRPSRTVLAALAVAFSVVLATPSRAQSDETPPGPCSTAEYRQFDFWVGSWVVRAGAGRESRNAISLVHDGCALLEDYVSGRYSGSSLSFWDRGARVWRQTWIDNQGSPLLLEGGLKDGNMVLSSDPSATPLQRVTWTPLPDGQVRQLWESSPDGGATWNTVFDGMYSKE